MGRFIPSVVAVTLLALPPCTSGAAAQGQFAIETSLTAGQLLSRLRVAIKGITDNTERFRASADTALADLRELTSQIEASFAGDAAAPLADVDGRMKAQVEGAVAALVLAEDLAASIRTCIPEDVRTLLGAFQANVRRVIRDAHSWSGGRPGILRAAGVDGAMPFGVRTGVAETISFAGHNLDSDRCGPVTATLETAGGMKTELGASSDGKGGIRVEISPLSEPGVYDLKIRLRRRKLIFFCRSETAAATMAVLPAARFRVMYAISTMRSTVQEIVWNAGELKRGNNRCDRDTTVVGTFSLPEGWTYASHNWIVFLNSGAVKENEEVTGNGVYVRYRVPERSGPLCTGPEKLIHGKMEIVGTRTRISAGPAIDTAYPRSLTFGESVSVPVDLVAGDGASIDAWTIEVRFVNPDGSVRTIPARTGSGPLSGALARSGAFSWDPASRRLRITAPGQTCQVGPAPAQRAGPSHDRRSDRRTSDS